MIIKLFRTFLEEVILLVVFENTDSDQEEINAKGYKIVSFFIQSSLGTIFEVLATSFTELVTSIKELSSLDELI